MSARADVDSAFAETIERDGYVVVPDAIGAGQIDSLIAAVGGVESRSRENGVYGRAAVYGLRNLFHFVPTAKDVLHEPLVREVVEGVLGPGAFCVRGLYLDRPPRANWRVPWHQDATITVKGRIDATGFGPWTVKSGVQHVMAPPGTLSAMLTVRVYLDDCGEREGVLHVIPSSHQYGRLPEDSIEQFTRYSVTPCPVSRGGLVALHPLLLRRSDVPVKPGPRRVLQLDFAARRLPLPLEWHESYPLR